MRRYIITVPGDNDPLHEQTLKDVVQTIEHGGGRRVGHGVTEAVVVAPEFGHPFPPVLNCVRRVK